MRSKTLTLSLSIILALAVVGGFALIVATLHTVNAASQQAQATAAATPTPDPYGCNAPLQGDPALGVPSIRPTGSGAVALTEQDVRNYLSHRYQGSGVILTIDSIQFMTSAQACIALGGEHTGIKADAMTCLVRLHGVNPASAGGRPFKYSVIYDAHTGNLLINQAGT